MSSLPFDDPFAVMPGLVPGIHVFAASWQEDVDGRDKPGHDDAQSRQFIHSQPWMAGTGPAMTRINSKPFFLPLLSCVETPFQGENAAKLD
jgi:hypothetical protein